MKRFECPLWMNHCPAKTESTATCYTTTAATLVLLMTRDYMTAYFTTSARNGLFKGLSQELLVACLTFH